MNITHAPTLTARALRILHALFQERLNRGQFNTADAMIAQCAAVQARLMRPKNAEHARRALRAAALAPHECSGYE